MGTGKHNFICPVNFQEQTRILLSHGGGGRLMQQLIEKMILPAFDNKYLNKRHDGAVIQIGNIKIAFTTDSFVVNPLFFPGGDIGSLAINGTVNDLTMCGARPAFISAGFIIEEGLEIDLFQKIINSMKKSAEITAVQLVTGDTKVVENGKGDGIFINTSGIGIIEHQLDISPENVQPGDAIIINGDIARHGISIMAMREGLEFESKIESDCAPVSDLVFQLIDNGIEIHCMRDPTRGGIASALNEIAFISGFKINILEKELIVREDVQGACEILGFDPLYVANEGKFIAFVKESDANRAIEIMSLHPSGLDSRIIGKVLKNDFPIVTMTSKIGTSRIIDLLSGEQLPRIC